MRRFITSGLGLKAWPWIRHMDANSWRNLGVFNYKPAIFMVRSGTPHVFDDVTDTQAAGYHYSGIKSPPNMGFAIGHIAKFRGVRVYGSRVASPYPDYEGLWPLWSSNRGDPVQDTAMRGDGADFLWTQTVGGFSRFPSSAWLSPGELNGGVQGRITVTPGGELSTPNMFWETMWQPNNPHEVYWSDTHTSYTTWAKGHPAWPGFPTDANYDNLYWAYFGMGWPCSLTWIRGENANYDRGIHFTKIEVIP